MMKWIWSYWIHSKYIWDIELEGIADWLSQEPEMTRDIQEHDQGISALENK